MEEAGERVCTCAKMKDKLCYRGKQISLRSELLGGAGEGYYAFLQSNRVVGYSSKKSH